MPAYNAAKTLERTYADIPHDIVGGIILVDDVSRDETVQVARQLGLDVIIHPQNRGYGGNQKTCYDAALAAGADIVVMLHPDYQYDATRIPALVAPIADGTRDLMLGSRFLGDPLGGGMPRWKFVSNRFLTGDREPRVRAPPVRVPHGPAGLQPAPARDDPIPPQQRRLRLRPGADRPGRGRRDGAADRRDRGTDALLRRGVLGRVPPQRGVRPVDAPGRRRGSFSIGYGSVGRASSPPDAGRTDPMARLSRRSLLRGGLGIAISLVAIWLLLRAVDIEAAFDVLRSASPAWIALMVGTVFIDIAARGVRWRVLLAPIAPLPYRRVLGYTYLGYLANNVLPARLGELYRSHALGEGEGVSRTTVLGTVVVERVVDTVMVVAIASLAVLVLSVRGLMTSAVLAGLAFVALLIVGLGLGMAAHRLPGADRVAAIIARRPRLLELARRLREGLAVAARPRVIVAALFWSAVAWTASTCTFLAGGQAVGVQLTVAQAALLTSGVALASIVPAGPANAGTFELTVVLIARGLGIPEDTAFAMGLLVHAMILGVTSVGGVVAGVRLGVWHAPLEVSERNVGPAPDAAMTRPDAGGDSAEPTA